MTPDEPAELETPSAREFRRWLERIGARVIVLDADEHDRIVARTSHLPQLASTGLAALLADAARVDISGSGLADMTRLAMSSYDLWRDILATNADHIEKALGQYIQELEHLRENLRTRQLQEEFDRGARLAKSIRSTRPEAPATGCCCRVPSLALRASKESHSRVTSSSRFRIVRTTATHAAASAGLAPAGGAAPSSFFAAAGSAR